MSAAGGGLGPGTLAIVLAEHESNEEHVFVDMEERRGVIQADFRVGAGVAAAQPLGSNIGLSFMGVTLVGEGFRIERSDFARLGLNDKVLPTVVRPYRSGKELTQSAKERWVIDFFGMDEVEARRQHPQLYQRLLDLVRPSRAAKGSNNKDAAGYAAKWWLFAKPRPEMRKALRGLNRYVATVETSKFKPFVFISGDVIPDHKLYAVASDDALILGVLSSRVHQVWALAAGGHLGVGNDPTWTNTTCFLPFPFPTGAAKVDHIRASGEELDAHRKRQQAAHPDLTITGMYNVLEKLRSGEALTAKDKIIHEQGLVSVLKKLHDDLDAAVFDAYGWPHDLTDEQILERLVALNAERAAEERRGLIRWLRPAFQNPTGAKAASQEKLATSDEPDDSAAVPVAATAAAWPKKLAEQIAAVRDLVTKGAAEWSKAEVAAAFKGANKADVEEVLDSLAALGILAAYDARGTRRWKATRTAV
jgi:hypothetical protein